MPDFSYIARDSAGQKITGTLSAATEREVIARLTGQALFPIEVSAGKAPTRTVLFRRVGGQHLATCYGQLASLLRSGVPLLRALAVMRKQTSHKVLSPVLQEVHDRVEDGATLAEAMARHEKVFSETAVGIVRAGGEGGFLEDALDRVAQFTERQEDLKSRTIGALVYPIFLACFGTAVVAGLLIFYIPILDEIFSDLRDRGDLPALTEAMLWTSSTLRSWGLVIVFAAVIAAFLIRGQLATEPGRRLADRIKLRLPWFGRILKDLAVARFCRVLGTLLTNGVPILKSLQISRDATGNRILSEAIGEASENISAGESLAGPLAESGQFPPTVVEMIAVAEESNTLDRVLVDIADGLETRTARRLDLAVRLLEPVLLLVLAVIVLLVIIAVLMPVLKMSGTVAA